MRLLQSDYEHCTLCPRRCGADRQNGVGYCGMGAVPTAAKACLHKWEEPCIAYRNGAGTVFFSGCSLHCVYCQNNVISRELYGAQTSADGLADIFLRLQEQGADNIELVTPTHFLPDIIAALEKVKPRLTVPVVYNTGGYELAETIRRLDGLVDVYLPDIKYFSPELSARYSNAPDYFEHASAAVTEMIRQAGDLNYNEAGGLLKGTIIRHLVLPNCRHDSIKIMEWIAEHSTSEQMLVSIMNQYTPFDFIPDSFPELKRRVTKMEYNSVVRRAAELGLNGFTQEKSSADAQYVPDFDLSGIK